MKEDGTAVATLLGVTVGKKKGFGLVFDKKGFRGFESLVPSSGMDLTASLYESDPEVEPLKRHLCTYRTASSVCFQGEARTGPNRAHYRWASPSRSVSFALPARS